MIRYRGLRKGRRNTSTCRQRGLGVEASGALKTPVTIPGYKIDKRIGSGGMGEVLLATQESLGRRVAIKLLLPGTGRNTSERLARFEREAQLLASLSHPNIVPVVDRGVVEGRPFIVMEHVEGESLRNRLHTEGSLETEETLTLLAHVTEALAYLHERGVVHRDVKPGNILVATDGTVKLADFGLASNVGEIGVITQASTTLGTLDYAAPEQRHGLDIDERADVFSLAVVAYQMLTGELPLGTFAMPSELKPELGAAVDDVLARALARDPDERCPTAASFYEELAAACRAKPKTARPYRALLTAAAVTAIGVGFLVGLLPERNRGASSARPATTPTMQPSRMTRQRGTSRNRRDINTATVYDLGIVSGVGPELARRIVTERERRGGFTALTQLLSVPGIGEKRFVALEEEFCIGVDANDR